MKVISLITALASSILLMASTSWSAASPGSAEAKPSYPRIAAILIGRKDYQDASLVRQVGKVDAVVYQFLPSHSPRKMSRILQEVKAANPDLLAFQYVIHNERTTRTDTSWAPAVRKMNSEKWWLYNADTNERVILKDFPRIGVPNYTLFGPADASGIRYGEWFAQWTYRKYFKNVPEWDGVYLDNIWWQPRNGGDWNRDGVNDSPRTTETAKWHRDGLAVILKEYRGLLNGKLVVGNIGSLGHEKAVYPEFDGLIDGGSLENYVGYRWSAEGLDFTGKDNGWGSWKLMMDRYYRSLGAVNAPGLVMFNQYGDPEDYQAFRYGFASSLLGGAYYIFTRDGSKWRTIEWFDEYDLAGRGTTSWLGRAKDDPPKTAWSKGVYRRDFENGIVLVNPRGNGDTVVQIEAGYMTFPGRQDPAVNSGQPVRELHIPDRSGVLLVNEHFFKNLPKT